LYEGIAPVEIILAMEAVDGGHLAPVIRAVKLVKRGYTMIGLLVVKPLLLLGGISYLGYRLVYKPIKSHLDVQKDGEFARSGGINMKCCPECNTYFRGDAIECPSCNGNTDHPSSPG
jgi:hypothetical protein